MSMSTRITPAGMAALCLLFGSQPALAQDNKQIAVSFAEDFGAGDVATLEKIVAENVVDHTLPPGGP